MSTPPIRLSPILPGWICSRKLTMAQAGHSLIKTSSLISLIPQALRYLIRHLGTLLKIPAELITEQQHQEFYDTFGDYCDRIFIENFAPCWPEFDIEKRTGFTMSKGIYQQELTNTETCPYIFYSMSINSDGSASACFLDWARKLIVGDAKTQNIREIWNSVAFNRLRIQNLKGKRMEHPVCSKCGQLTHCLPDNIDPYQKELLTKVIQKSQENSHKY